MKKNLILLIFASAMISVLPRAYGQLSTNELPVSFGLSNGSNLSRSASAIKTMPALNMATISHEDSIDAINRTPPRFAYPHPVNYSLNNSGKWDTLSNGDQLWRLNINCPGALSISIVYDSFWLPDGAKYFVYSQDKSKHIGAFTSINNKGTKLAPRGFSTALIFSDQITLEYYVPSGIERGIISIAKVVQGYRYISNPYFGASAPCEININCPEGDNWQNEKHAIALVLIDENTRICTGALINTTAHDSRPLFLTANHCISAFGYDVIDNPYVDDWLFYWNYESPNCENPNSDPMSLADNLGKQFSTGATIVANNFISDFALLQLKEDPRNLPDADLFYLGWDRSENMSAGGVCIHHPQGDLKKISTYTTFPATSINCGINYLFSNFLTVQFTPTTTHNHFAVVESGSSGSPLINNNKKIIGQLMGMCDGMYCENPPSPLFGPDTLSKRATYGKFSVSWTGGGATENERKLQPWLDPINSGAMSVDGMLPIHLPLFNLLIRDAISDNGAEPSNVVEFWNSPDIWIRNNDDNGTESQNPEYHPSKPNWVYVRVKNVGFNPCPTNGAELTLHWAKAHTALTWDYHWTGNFFPNSSTKIGDTIGILSIPSLNVGEDIILKFPWIVPNPADYEDINAEPWHFCLLARIVSDEDPMTFPETADLAANVPNNNNIAMKNLTVVDVQSNSITTAVAVGNISATTQIYDLIFKSPSAENGKKVQEEAEVSIKLDNALSSKWQQSGRQGSNIERKRNGDILIKAANASLTNLTFLPNEIATINVSFNFLTKEITQKENYTYSIILKDHETGEIIGGESYQINKEPRPLFYANAGNDREVIANQAFTLNAELLSEDAVYNWYDENDSLIYEGTSFTTSTAIGHTYTLEVVALTDGYKDYATVEVEVKPNLITNVYPNPISNIVNIEYHITNASTASISITNYYNTQITNTYTINVNSQIGTFNTGTLPTGIYVVTLVCDGQIADSKILVKE